MNTTRKLVLAFAAFTMFFGTIAEASAATWAQTHPRRVEVNTRLAHQNARINHNLAKGNITPRQAARLKAQDRTIRRQERVAASFNGGHLTRAQQRALNQEENAVSRRIYRTAH